MNEAVRAAIPDDAADLAELERAARASVADQRGGARRLAEVPEVGDWSEAVVEEDRVWVATIDDVVVGYLELIIGGEIAEVRQVWVQPEAREVGLGDSLLEHAVDAARRRRCTVLEGTALPGDRDTKNLYERAGITARKIVVSTRL